MPEMPEVPASATSTAGRCLTVANTRFRIVQVAGVCGSAHPGKVRGAIWGWIGWPISLFAVCSQAGKGRQGPRPPVDASTHSTPDPHLNLAIAAARRRALAIGQP